MPLVVAAGAAAAGAATVLGAAGADALRADRPSSAAKRSWQRCSLKCAWCRLHVGVLGDGCCREGLDMQTTQLRYPVLASLQLVPAVHTSHSQAALTPADLTSQRGAPS